MINDLWYGKSSRSGLSMVLTIILAPFGWLYYLVVTFRRWAYLKGFFKRTRLPVQVIVVGNITVGGTGKTPLVIWLVNFLREQGYQPGIISRGYGGQVKEKPLPVHVDSDPAMVGDEPVLLARHGHCPVYIFPDRTQAGQALLAAYPNCNIIVCDDGLQHYALDRDIEICMIDSSRGHGNKRCLPAGPLREPVSRLQSIDLIVCNGGADLDEFNMTLKPDKLLRVDGEGHPIEISHFKATEVHAVAGIGNPRRFFRALRDSGLDIITHEFRDHHKFSFEDIEFKDKIPVIMTEKDAVKCVNFAEQHHWYLQVMPVLPDRFGDNLLTILKKSSKEENNG